MHRLEGNANRQERSRHSTYFTFQPFYGYCEKQKDNTFHKPVIQIRQFVIMPQVKKGDREVEGLNLEVFLALESLNLDTAMHHLARLLHDKKIHRD